MIFYYSNRRVGPWVGLVLMVALVLLLPVISGFFLLLFGSMILGMIGLSIKRGLSGSKPKARKSFQNPKEDHRVVVMDKDDNVITIQDS